MKNGGTAVSWGDKARMKDRAGGSLSRLKESGLAAGTACYRVDDLYGREILLMLSSFE